MRRSNVVYILMILLISTFIYGQETLKMFVKENKEPCQGVAPMECLQVKYPDSKDWELFYDSIDGFNFEKGNKYEIIVVKTKRQGNIPADASLYEYKLKKIVSKKSIENNKGIYNTKIVLTMLNGKNINAESIYLTIDTEEGMINGKSGCNSFGVKYTKLSKKDRIQIGSPFGTLKACDEASMQLEQDFINTIKDKKFKIINKKNKVLFKNLKNKTIMEFTIASQNDIWNYIGKNNWKLIMLENVVQDYGKASIKFDISEKKVNGNTGCNGFFGSYSLIGDDHIQFNTIGATMKACLDEEVNKMEQKVLSLLNNKNLRFDVADQTLNFYLDDKLVMMFGKTE